MKRVGDHVRILSMEIGMKPSEKIKELEKEIDPDAPLGYLKNTGHPKRSLINPPMQEVGDPREEFEIQSNINKGEIEE